MITLSLQQKSIINSIVITITTIVFSTTFFTTFVLAFLFNDYYLYFNLHLISPIHLLTLMIWCGFIAFIMIPIYRQRALPYFIIIYALDEIIWNGEYIPMHINIINFIKPNWIITMSTLILLAILFILVLKPKIDIKSNIRLLYLLIPFIIFDIIYIYFGMPLLNPVTQYGYINTTIPSNAIFEFGWQLTYLLGFGFIFERVNK